MEVSHLFKGITFLANEITCHLRVYLGFRRITNFESTVFHGCHTITARPTIVPLICKIGPQNSTVDRRTLFSHENFVQVTVLFSGMQQRKMLALTF